MTIIGESIYTLAQNDTRSNQKTPVIVTGKGSSIDEVSVLEGKSKRKIITNSLMIYLVDYARENGDLNMVQPYWNTFHCLGKVYVSEGKLFGNYCKNRFCAACCAIRKAELINKYKPIIEQWEDPQFVTLTVKSQPYTNLNKWMNGMIEAFRLIKNRCNARYKRGNGIKLIGIKSLECNFNPRQRSYNPHFHIIVPNKEIASLLKKEWLNQWTRKFTYKGAQDIVQITDLDKGLIEVLKYSTKIFTEIDPTKERRKKGEHKIYIAAMHNIFKALKGHRLFGSFGFTLPKVSNDDTSTLTLLQDYSKLKYDTTEQMYVDEDTDEVLFDYGLPEEIRVLLMEKVDVELK